MTRAHQRIAAIWAISAWPALNFIAANWGEVLRGGVKSIAGVLLVSLTLAIAGHALHRWRAKSGHGDRVMVACVVGICLFFGYMVVRNASAMLLGSLELPIPPSIGWLIVATLAFVLVWRFGRYPQAQIGAITFSLVVASLAALALVGTALRAAPEFANDTPAEAAQQTERGRHADLDVFYIVLDAYAGDHGLGEVLGFDNSAFLARMSRRGFMDVSSDHANYLTTAQTLGAIFSLDYTQTEDPRTWRNAWLYPALFDHARIPPFLARLATEGYVPWYSGSLPIGCPARHFHCLAGTAIVEPDHMTQVFLASTPLGRGLLQKLEGRRDALVPLAARLPSLLESDRPIFVFVHHLSPHPPFTLNRNCRSRTMGKDSWDSADSDSRDGYVEAVECVNSKVEQLVDLIVEKSPGAMIVLEGDHGSDFTMNWAAPIEEWSDASIRERASFLNLVRAPPDCARWLDRPLGQINTARFVLACIGGRAPNYLPERTYLSTYASGPETRVVRGWRDSAGEMSRPAAAAAVQEGIDGDPLPIANRRAVAD